MSGTKNNSVDGKCSNLRPRMKGWTEILGNSKLFKEIAYTCLHMQAYEYCYYVIVCIIRVFIHICTVYAYH